MCHQGAEIPKKLVKPLAQVALDNSGIGETSSSGKNRLATLAKGHRGEGPYRLPNKKNRAVLSSTKTKGTPPTNWL